jgi:hypothetical protein
MESARNSVRRSLRRSASRLGLASGDDGGLRARESVNSTTMKVMMALQKDLLLMQQKRILDSDDAISAVDEKERFAYRQLEKTIDRRQGLIAGLALVSLGLGSLIPGP